VTRWGHQILNDSATSGRRARSDYLCGPDRGTYFQTMQLCCGKDWNKAGDYCRDLRDPAPDAGSRSESTH